MGDAGESRNVVVIKKCRDYELSRLRSALQELLEPLGGMKNFVGPGKRVLLKPNLLSAKDPDRAITTHPNLVEVVAEAVRECGGVPFVGDSPGGAIRGIKRVWQNTGMQEMAERAGMELVNFEAAGSKRIEEGDYAFFVSKPVLEADTIISLPKLKTHSLTLLTCAVKNMFGVIPGFRKGEFHKLFPKPGEFSAMLVHLYKLVTPSLNIVDAVVAMEGNGPSSGRPFELGLLIAGRDGIAVDKVAARTIGFEEDHVDTIRIAREIGLGNAEYERIDLAGDGVGTRASDFELPSNRVKKLVPRPLVKIIAPFVWVKPVIDPGRCTGCAFCFESCPVDAIERKDDVYEIKEAECVKCLCCHELCPESSIDIKLSPLARLFV